MKSVEINSAIVLLIVVLVFGISVSLQSILAWTIPSASPPGGNVARPLDTSSSVQTKTGGLVLDSLRITGGAPGPSKVLTSDASGQASWQNPVIAGIDRLHDVMSRGNTTTLSMVLLNNAGIDQQSNNFFYINSYDGLQLRINSDGAGSGSFKINNSSNNTIFTALNSGSIGIGTTVPATKLNIGGSVGASLYCNANGKNCKTVEQLFNPSGITKFTVSSWKHGSSGSSSRCTGACANSSCTSYYCYDVEYSGVPLDMLSQCGGIEGCNLVLNELVLKWTRVGGVPCVDFKYTYSRIDQSKIMYDGSASEPRFIAGATDEWDFWDPVTMSYTKFPTSVTKITSLGTCVVAVNSRANINAGQPKIIVQPQGAYPGLCYDSLLSMYWMNEYYCDAVFF